MRSLHKSALHIVTLIYVSWIVNMNLIKQMYMHLGLEPLDLN